MRQRPVTFSQVFRGELRALRHSNDAGLFGLAISGGGIRSATFALGVIQHLAKLKLLRKLDYLSTVSGGGYIGSWLSAAWIRARDAGISFEQFEAGLRPPGEGRTGESPLIGWLRSYSCYLAPKTSLFSPDTWLVFTIWLRNTLLNLVPLAAAVCATLFLPWMLVLAYPNWSPPLVCAWELLVLGLVAAVLGEWRRWIWAGVASAVMLSAAAVVATFSLRVGMQVSVQQIWFARMLGAAAAFALMLWFINWRGELSRRGGPRAVLLLRAVLGALLGGAGLPACPVLALRLAGALERADLGYLIPVVTPAVLGLLLSILTSLLIGLAGAHMYDERREWWSRLAAWMTIFFLVWLLVASAALLGPLVIFVLRANWAYLIATGGLWALITGLGAYFGRSPATSATPGARRGWLERLLPIAPLVFMVGVLVLAGALDFALLGGGLHPGYAAFEQPGDKSYPFWAILMNVNARYVAGVWRLAANPGLWALGALLVFLIATWLLDINEFSMHRFYRNRLVRAYPGASHAGRRPEPFTGLDPEDDVPIRALRLDGARPVRGPVHLVNTAVNLTGASPGVSERRAASFVFTPYACGYSVGNDSRGHYRRYRRDSRFPLGAAMAISGAAASPNMGYHTSAPVAFLMTLFNVRLGWWMFNPRPARPAFTSGQDEPSWPSLPLWFLKRHWKLPRWMRRRLGLTLRWRPTGPRMGTAYYLAELLALANDRRKFVYLSDGGHFENLAVYELLRRRCAYIICIDGEQDGDYTFGGLASLVRKARVDFGAEIEIDASPIAARGANTFSQAHCAVGDIRYADGRSGLLLYLKASLTGDEPTDVLGYAITHTAFPHQTTGDQFFSESQFESYRRLGVHVASRVLGLQTMPVPDSFLKLRRLWR